MKSYITYLAKNNNVVIILFSLFISLLMVAISALIIEISGYQTAGINLKLIYLVISLVGFISAFLSIKIVSNKGQLIFQDNDKDFSIGDDYKYNQSLLEAALESTADGIIIVDNKGRIVRANKKFNQLWKIPEFILQSSNDQELYKYVWDQLKDPNSFSNKVLELYSNPEQESLDTVIFKDGRVFERYSMPHRMGNKIVGRLWSFYDITSHIHVKESLQRERTLLRTVIDNIPDAIYAKDLEFKKTLSSRADFMDLGLKNEEEVLGKTDYDFYTKQDADIFSADDKKVLEGQSIINREEISVDKNGKKHWLLTTKLPIIAEDGKTIGLVGIGRDITKRKKTELIRQALLDISEAAYTAVDMFSLYRRIHEVISTLMSVKNIYIALYDETTELLSFPYFIDEFDPPQAPKKLGTGLTEYVLRTGKASLISSQKDLELRERGEVSLIGAPAAIWLGVPLKIGEKTIGVIVVQDYDREETFGEEEMQLLIFVSEQIAQVIERKRNSDSIKKYAEELKQLNITKDKFFSIIAHDLKNPFITIMGFSDLLLSDFAELSEDEKLFFIGEMKKSADLSHNLLQNLLQWSRSQTGRIEYNPSALNLTEIVDNIFMLLLQSAGKKKIILEKVISGEIFILADKDMVETVIRNLLTNAIKFCNEKDVIKVKAEPKGDFVEICVKDSGIGMDEKTVNSLFKLEAAQSHIGTADESGTGLGLILCKEFIEKHGGEIRVESELGKGSKFIFNLPVCKNKML